METSLGGWVQLGYGREGDRESIILGLLLGILPDMGAALISERQARKWSQDSLHVLLPWALPSASEPQQPLLENNRKEPARLTGSPAPQGGPIDLGCFQKANFPGEQLQPTLWIKL